MAADAAVGVTPRPAVPIPLRPVDLSLTFEAWYRSQPELQQMRRIIHVNPAAALELVLPRAQPPLAALQVGPASPPPKMYCRNLVATTMYTNK
jgi:hypothetical protein